MKQEEINKQFEQLERCTFECIAGSLENSVAYKNLKEAFYKNPYFEGDSFTYGQDNKFYKWIKWPRTLSTFGTELEFEFEEVSREEYEKHCNS